MAVLLSRFQKWIVHIVVLLCGLSLISLQGGLLPGPNVCIKTVTKRHNVSRAVKVPYEVKTYTFCVRIRCDKTRTEYFVSYRTVNNSDLGTS